MLASHLAVIMACAVSELCVEGAHQDKKSAFVSLRKAVPSYISEIIETVVKSFQNPAAAVFQLYTFYGVYKEKDI